MSSRFSEEEVGWGSEVDPRDDRMRVRIDSVDGVQTVRRNPDP